MPKKTKEAIIAAIDILFIMILCFVSLLVPMLIRGKVLVGSGASTGMHYTFYWPSFLLTLLIIGGYIYFILTQSDKELRQMISAVYDGRSGKKDKHIA